jgi:hypothetical protein
MDKQSIKYAVSTLERALPAELCEPLTLYKMEGVGFEPTQPVRAADLQSAPINHSGTPP